MRADGQTYRVKATYVDLDHAHVETGYYGDGSLAVILVQDGESEPVSVNLRAYADQIGMPNEGEFYVKNYSEHEGLAAALQRAGIATAGPLVTFGPFATNTAVLMTLNPEAVS